MAQQRLESVTHESLTVSDSLDTEAEVTPGDIQQPEWAVMQSCRGPERDYHCGEDPTGHLYLISGSASRTKRACSPWQQQV